MTAHIVKRPVISEKTLLLASQQNQYTFEVAREANKNQIIEAVEDMFNVEVTGINTIKGHRVKKSTGKKRMKTVVAPTKKAIVTLKKGQTISVFDFGGAE